jgi:hypothetical protein
VHGHWRIENNGFKRLSEQCGSKHKYIRKKEADKIEECLALVLILFLGMLFRLWYELNLDLGAVKKVCGKLRMSSKILIESCFAKGMNIFCRYI